MTRNHHAPLCAAPHCRVRGQHTTDCPGGDCRGCLPRPAADGLALCWPHTEWLARDARQAAWLYGELEHVLIGAPAVGGRVSGSPDRTRLPNMAAVEARTLIRHTLVSWCRLIAEERGIDLPRDEVAAMGDYIARHAHWLAAHPAAGEAADELRELAHGRPWRVAYPDSTRRVEVGPCPHDGCGGTIRAVLRASDSLLPSRIVCDANADHVWPASEWITLGRQLRRIAA